MNWQEFISLERAQAHEERDELELLFLYQLLADLFGEGPLA